MKTILLTLLVFAMATTMAVSQQAGDISNVTDVDGNVYETKFMKDGNWWMLENLKVTKHPDGKAAKFVYPWNGSSNDESLVALGAGLLYDRDSLMGWPHALREQGLCPNQWHIPSRDEIENLLRSLGKEPTLWTGDGAWAPLAIELNLGAIRGGKWDPTKKDFTDPALTGWGVYIYTSTTAYGNKAIAFMLALAADGSNGGITQDPKTVAGNCRCVKNKEVKVTVSDITDGGMVISLSNAILTDPGQVKIYDVTDPTDPWMVELTSVAFSSEDKKSITVKAYLDASLGNKYEVRFFDSQVPKLPLKGYELKFDGSTGIAPLTAASLKLFPNPATNELKINMDGLSKIAIFNIAGQEILAKTDLKKMAVINISGLQSGVYFIKATNSKGAEINSKFIKK